MVPARFDGPSLATIHTAALPAAPGKAGERDDLLLQRMVRRYGQHAITIHLGHLSQKVGSVVGTSLEDVVLPLMDHFVGQRAREFVLAIRSLREGLRQQRNREPNLPMTRRAHAPALYGHAWADGRD